MNRQLINTEYIARMPENERQVAVNILLRITNRLNYNCKSPIYYDCVQLCGLIARLTTDNNEDTDVQVLLGYSEIYTLRRCEFYKHLLNLIEDGQTNGNFGRTITITSYEQELLRNLLTQ